MGSSSEFFNLTWNEFHSTVANSFMDLRTKDEFLDVTLAIDQDHQCQAHKVILSASSPYFRSVLKRNPAQHPILVMPPNVRYSDLTALLDFVYQGEVKIPTTELQEFLALAEHLKIKGLTESASPETKKSPTKPNMPVGAPSGPPQMAGRRRPSGQQQPPNAKPSPQAKRHRLNNDPNFGTMPQPPQSQGNDNEETIDDDVHAISDEGNEMYDEYGEQYEGSQESYQMDPNAGGPPGPASSNQPPQKPVLTGLLCPTCRQMCHGVEALKAHISTVHGDGGGGSGGNVGKGKKKNAGDHQEVEDKPHSCHICDKAFKTKQYVRNHMKRMHQVGADELEDPDGVMMGDEDMGMSPAKKKGRKKMNQGPRPVGQVPPAPRNQNDGKEMQEPSRPPVQQDRASIQRPGPGGIRAPMMGGPKRPPMGLQGITGPGMRPRGPAPHQFQPQYPPQGHPGGHGSGVDIQRLGRKLGGAISISSSDQQQSQSPSRRPPMPGPSRSNVSSPRGDPLASTSRSSMPRQSNLSQEPPIEVKQEPMEDDMYEEGEDIPDDFDEEDYGEEEEEEGLYEEGMYAGEAPYDEDVANDDDGEYAH